jgi:hypothetical protein
MQDVDLQTLKRPVRKAVEQLSDHLFPPQSESIDDDTSGDEKERQLGDEQMQRALPSGVATSGTHKEPYEPVCVGKRRQGHASTSP